jgi:hypothetical protein
LVVQPNGESLAEAGVIVYYQYAKHHLSPLSQTCLALA